MSQDAVNKKKEVLRQSILAGRERSHQCGHSHSQLLIDFTWELRAKTVACYISFGDEPSTNVYLKHCQLDERIELYVPRVIGENLEWVLFTSEQVTHPLGMSEPVGNATELPEVDLMVVPALAADSTGNRLGRGKGFYDRALEQIRAKKVIALVHDDEFFEAIPVAAHDAPIDAVCTCSELTQI
ncbi:MAG: 5-formyltetrahydrofolate cyclo-ligase [Rhodoluna sp.]|nr:5-formyltetrahydrofolate cyclo-ligase [Rhodoluna sp.]